MSKSPLKKILKQTELHSFLCGTMVHSIKTEAKGGPSKDVKQEVEDKKHTFNFNLNSGTFSVSCRSSMTVIEALNTSQIFRTEKDKKKNKEKEIIIQRSEGIVPRAAVKTDFPCCLIKKRETLDVTFKKTDGNNFTDQQTTAAPLLRKNCKPETLVSFWVKKDGGNKVKCLLKSKALRRTVRYVCVYGFKGEKVKTALKRDGRFNSIIFKKHCGLSEFSRDTKYELSIPVEDLDRKAFQVVVISDKPQPDSQDDWTSVKPEENEASDADEKQTTAKKASLHHSRQPHKTNEKNTGKTETTADPSTTEGHGAPNTVGSSGQSFSTHIEKILRPLFKDALKMLEVQENPQVQKLFQEDYDKGIQCFTEVKKVRKITELSDSVCLIQAEDSGRGTGFLAFDRFILTNAHVINDYIYSPPEHPHTLKLSRPLRAVFNYEGLGSEPKFLSVKEEIVAYGFNEDDRYRIIDFALLELEAPPENCTELFKHYVHAPHPKRGGMYIVGHPECKVKKMDPCFIIEPEKQLESINKHLSENLSCPLVSWQCWPYLHQNRITYDTCFFHGSSGSPVFDEGCYLIGMHSGGFAYKEGERTRSVIEYAYSMQSIVEAIVSQVKTRDEILKLLCKFESIAAQFNLNEIQDTCRTNIPLMEEQQSDVEEMEVQ